MIGLPTRRGLVFQRALHLKLPIEPHLILF
jgi:hypothetical protein